MDKTNERVVFLDYLRLIACFMVMVVHVVEPYYFDAAGNFYIETKSDAFWVAFLDSAARSCVPLFVMTSCYLLFPLRAKTGEFLRRRALRVLLPFLFWSAVYVWHFGGRATELCFNFSMKTAGHLWFVPMLFGLYLAMPLLSPWAEKVGKKELQMWLGLWFVTTLFPFVRHLSFNLLGEPPFGAVPFLWGECPWNAFGTFYYVSGFFGYLMIALYIRRFVPLFSWRKTLAVSMPLFLIGLAVMMGGVFCRTPGDGVFPVQAPYAAAVGFEMSLEFCSTGVALATVALFLLARKFTADGPFYRHVVLPLSKISYGTYLVHMLILVPICGALKGTVPMPVCVFAVAAMTYVLSMLLSFTVGKIPFIGRYLVGT
jgi:surface polysaccharide O-acyltransferase-like enzyme